MLKISPTSLFCVVVMFVFFTTSWGARAEMPKEMFVAASKGALPAFFCGKASPFRVCFPKVSDNKCRSVSNEAFDKCAPDVASEFPEQLDRNQARLLGKKIGQCVGRIYGTRFADGDLDAALCIVKAAKKMQGK